MELNHNELREELADIVLGNTLYHHGIIGQKWGVKHGPPYPLKESAKSSAEKAGDNYGSVGVATAAVATLAASTVAVVAVKKHAANAKFRKKVAAANKVLDKREAKKDKKELSKDLNKAYNNRDIESLEACPKTAIVSPEENMSKINPDFGAPGTTSNCVSCSVAMAMRQKGYDVKARTSLSTLPLEPVASAFSGAKIKSVNTKSYDKFSSQINSQGEGAYGILGLTAKVGRQEVGHAVFYQVGKEGTTVYDSQTGRKVDLKHAYSNMDLTDAVTVRLDNTEPKQKALTFVGGV